MSSFKHVYRGGHHDVFCDGEQHVRLSGGSFGRAPISSQLNLCDVKLNVFRCDCEHRKKAVA